MEDEERFIATVAAEMGRERSVRVTRERENQHNARNGPKCFVKKERDFLFVARAITYQNVSREL